MASKPLVIEARVATELLRGDAQESAALLGNVGAAAEKVADKLEESLGKAGAKFGPWAGAAQDAIAKVRGSSVEMAKEIERIAGRIANSNGDAGVAAARNAVDAQRAKLAAIIEVEAATRRMIGADRDLTATEQAYFDALQNTKNAAGARLTQLTAEAGALERLQIELRATGLLQEEQAAGGGNGGGGSAAMAAAADRLRAKIDPMFTAQRQFDDELTTAEALLANGAIRQNEYASAVALATTRLQAYQAALFDVGKAQTASAPAAVPTGPAAPIGPTAAEMAALAAGADRVRSALDPMYAAQKRFDEELRNAEGLLAAEIITEREYQGAVAVATQALRAHHDALFAVEGPADKVSNAHGRMSVSSMMVMHSVRASTDSFAAGLPPMMIFSEQIGRLAEASAYAAQESGKTTGAMAKFGAVMGGPWGIAITAGVSLLGTAIGHMDLFTDKAGEAVKKLQAQAEAEDVAARATVAFGNTLEGLIQREKKLGDELDRQIRSRTELNGLMLSQAQQEKVEAQQHVNQARTELDQAQRSQKAAQAQVNNMTNPMGGPGLAFVDPADAQKPVDAARKRYADAVKALEDADTNVRKAQVLDLQAKARGVADPKEAARQRISAAKDTLTNRYVLGMENPADYVSGYAALERQEGESKKSGKKGPSADTLAKREEAARVKLVNQDEAYTDQERAARHRLLDATGKTAASEEERDALLRQDIEAEAAAAKHKIADQLSANKINAVQAAHLIDLAEQTRIQKLKNVDLQRNAQDVKDSTAQDVAALDRQIAVEKIHSDMAATTQQRRDVELKILALQEQRERALAQEVLANPLSTSAEKDSANARLQAVDDQHGSNVAKIEQGTASPMQAYAAQLQKSTGDINSSLQSIEVSSLQSLGDGFANVVTQSETADKAVQSMVTSAIGQLAKLAAQNLILSFIGLKSGGSLGSVTGKANGGLLGFATGGLPGFAGGTRSANGMISGPGTGTSDSILALVNGKNPVMVSDDEGIVNAQAVRNYWPAIDAMNKGTFPRFATGGLLSPRIPSITGMGGGAQTVVQQFNINASGSVLANDLYTNLHAVATQSAAAALAAAPGLSQQQMSEASAQRIPT